MRIVVFSIIDDWDIGRLFERSGHEVVAWVRPSWQAQSKPSSWLWGIRHGLKWALAQDRPICNIVPRYDVREWLNARGIPMVACKDANEPEFHEALCEYEPDLFIVAMYPQIFKDALLAIPRLGVINYHPSMLPRYAGAQPGFWVLRNGEAETGITVHRMTEKIDAGDILMQEVVRIDRDEHIGHLMQKMHHRAAQLILATVDAMARGTICPTAQDGNRRSYFRKKTAADLAIDWNESSEELLRLLRAVQPFEPLTTSLRGRAFRIFDAKAMQGGNSGEPGEIVDKVGDSIVVQTGAGRLAITNCEIEPFHGWLNRLANRVLVAKGDRFDLVKKGLSRNEGA